MILKDMGMIGWQPITTKYNKVKLNWSLRSMIFISCDRMTSFKVADEISQSPAPPQCVHMCILSLWIQLKEDSSSLRDNQPDLFHFRLGGFQMLVESYPAGSQALTDATNLLQDFINQVPLKWPHMSIMASKIAVISSFVENIKDPHYWTFMRGTTDDRWIPFKKGQQCG